MRIAFISSSRDPSLPQIDSDGGAVTIRNYALELGRIGHIVDIYTGRATESSPNDKYFNTYPYIKLKSAIILLYERRS